MTKTGFSYIRYLGVVSVIFLILLKYSGAPSGGQLFFLKPLPFPNLVLLVVENKKWV